MRKAVMLLALPLFCSVAIAKGTYPPGPIADWFHSQRSGDGGSCCDQADGHLFYGNYTINADGSVDAASPLDGQTVHISADEVLNNPEPPGVDAAVWWYSTMEYNMGHPQIATTYCFHLGPQG